MRLNFVDAAIGRVSTAKLGRRKKPLQSVVSRVVEIEKASLVVAMVVVAMVTQARVANGQ